MEKSKGRRTLLGESKGRRTLLGEPLGKREAWLAY